MKFTLISICCILINYGAICQPTFSVMSHKGDLEEWDTYFRLFDYGGYGNQTETAFKTGFSLGVGYLIPFNKAWIALHPTLDFTWFKRHDIDLFGAYPGYEGDTRMNLKMQQTNLNLNARFYPFNLWGDQQRIQNLSDWKSFQKLIFLNISPGLTIVKQDFYNGETATYLFGTTARAGEVDKLYFRSTLGIGFDLPILKELSLSPFASIHRIKNFSSDILYEHGNSICPTCGIALFAVDEETVYMHYSFGVTVIFNFLN